MSAHLTPVTPLDGEKPRILVLEDNPESRLLLRHLLRKSFDATIVAGADDALAEAETRTFDVALLDINLGERRTGVDVLRLLRQMPEFGATPALACTAYALPGDREHFLEAGFADYVSKPFVKQDLIAALHRAISLAQAA
jgi:CheY-like chemotaxis protein